MKSILNVSEDQLTLLIFYEPEFTSKLKDCDTVYIHECATGLSSALKATKMITFIAIISNIIRIMGVF